jgi:hypothetical protein
MLTTCLGCLQIRVLRNWPKPSDVKQALNDSCQALLIQFVQWQARICLAGLQCWLSKLIMQHRQPCVGYRLDLRDKESVPQPAHWKVAYLHQIGEETDKR